MIPEYHVEHPAFCHNRNQDSDSLRHLRLSTTGSRVPEFSFRTSQKQTGQRHALEKR